MPYLDKMAKIEDIVFWIIMASIIAVAIWMLIGSPPLENGLLMITIFIASSIILMWKHAFSLEHKITRLDNKTALSFEKLKNEMNTRFNNIENKLDKIEGKL